MPCCSGAVLAPTDAAAVFSVLRKLPLPPRLSGTLEAESGLNDAPAVLAVTLLSGTGPHPSAPALVAGMVAYQLAAGAAIGVLAGCSARFSAAGGAARLRLVPDRGARAHRRELRGGVAGARERVPRRLPGRAGAGQCAAAAPAATRGFAEGIAWLAQIGLFVMLGLLASPARLPGAVLPALVAGFVLVLIARSAAVIVSTLPLRVPWRQRAFLSWAGLRGAVPIVLATIPLSARSPGATRLFDLVFVVVGVFTLLQGPTLPWAARRLKVFTPAEPVEIDVEAAPARSPPRRPAPGPDPAGLQAARRGDLRTAPARRSQRGPDRPGRARLRPWAHYRAASQ